NTPALLGLIEHRPDDTQPSVFGALFDFVRNQGDCWQTIIEALERHLDDLHLLPTESMAENVEASVYVRPLDLPHVIGQRTAEMHKALAIDTADSAFAREAVDANDLKRWITEARSEISGALTTLERIRSSLDEETAALVERLLAQRSGMERRLEELEQTPVSAAETRIHGDFHLGQ